MGCVYKFGGVTYNSLEELMSFVNKNNTENTIEKKDESSPSFFSKVLKNIFSIAVASNPSKNGINSQKPYSTQEQQLEAYGILSNEPKSVQLGSVLNLKRFKWTLLILFTIGIISHRLFCVETTVGKIIFNI